MVKKTDGKPKKKIPEKSLANLRPFNTLTPERRREIAKMGAAATNKLINTRKTLREIAIALGNMRANDREKERLLEMFPDADPDTITKNMMLIASMFNQAVGRGNVQAFTAIRDTAGEKPDTTINGTLTTQKIFVSPEEQQQALEHIAEVVADDGADR